MTYSYAFSEANMRKANSGMPIRHQHHQELSSAISADSNKSHYANGIGGKEFALAAKVAAWPIGSGIALRESLNSRKMELA